MATSGQYLCAIWAVCCSVYISASPIHRPALSSSLEWTEQYGTVEYPRNVHLSPDVRRHDVYAHDGRLYRALAAGTYVSHSVEWAFPTRDEQSTRWQEIPKGSYLNPKRLPGDTIAIRGDLYIDDDTGEFYRALETVYLEGGETDYKGNGWERVNSKAEWMTLIKDKLSSVRIGDMILPGSHDSGTFGITANHTLVDRNELFSIAPPEILANWSRNHDESLRHQLEGGYRYLDLRVASLDNGDFRWWHGVTGTLIQPGLEEIVNFATSHPQELVLLDLSKLRAPGDDISNTLPMPDERKDELIAILRQTILPRVVDRRQLTNDNPTAQEVWDTGKNLLVYCDDQYILDRVPEFWPNIVNHLWVGKSNPEEQFVERSEKLNYYKQNFADQLSYIGIAVTPNDKIIIGAILRLIGWDAEWRDIVAEVFPEIANLSAEEMSFEGLHLSLVDLADSANTAGMDARPRENYTSVASVHYKAMDLQIDYWLARRNLYKPNVIGVDKSQSSRVVESAIRANSQPVPQEVAIAFQGNTRDGFLEWQGYNATGGREGYACSTGLLSYAFAPNLDAKTPIPDKTSLVFRESQYPPETVVVLYAASSGSSWHELGRYNIQTMIDNNEDLYARVVGTGDGSGFAYLSTLYNNFGIDCVTAPNENIVKIVYW